VSVVVDAATEAQRRAASPSASAWVAASAGSGKTKVLTDRVLNLLLEGTAPSRILCLTFTKAAAAEMAIRLGDRLRHWATKPDDEVEKSLADLTGAPVEPDLAARARQLFARVLDAPGGIRIQTIHSFCQSLLARFPLEAGVVPHFELLDERGEVDLLAEAREAVLRTARDGADPTLAAALMEATRHTNEDGFAEVLQEVLAERGKLRLLLAHGGIEAVRKRLAAALGVDPALRAESIIAAAGLEMTFDGVGLRRAADALLRGSEPEQERGRKLADWLSDPAGRESGFTRYVSAFVKADGEIVARLCNNPTEQRCPGTRAILQREAERILAATAALRARSLFDASSALIRLGAGVLEAYEHEKRLRAALDFDDLIARARGLLERPGIAPWVLFKLDGGIDHILVDEAQDTNLDQWRIVQALADEFFAGAGAREHRRTIFAVGDKKQSIFGFQGAQPEEFTAMHTYFAARTEHAKAGAGIEAERVPPLVKVPLNISFRSTSAVLAAVDLVFGAGGPGADGVAEADYIRHVASREGQAGRVELWPLVPRPEPVEEERWALPLERPTPPLPRTRLATEIARTVRRWIDDGEMLPARGRPIRAGDVMILVRRRNALVADLVRALRQERVPVAGVDRMRLARELAVEDLVALAEFLLTLEDDLGLAVVLKGPLFGLDDDDLFALCHARQGTLWDELRRRADERPRWTRAAMLLSELLARADFVPPYELFAEVLGARGGRKAMLGRLGTESGDALDEFLALALRYERSNVPSLQGFLHWLRSGEIELKRELEQRGRDEVRIMTVHGAKGLQAPIVILPDTTSVAQLPVPLRWTDDGLLLWCPNKDCDAPLARTARAGAERQRDREYRRLLYVAMTRAEDRLYVVGCANGRSEPESCWYQLARRALVPVATPLSFDKGEGWSGEMLRLENPQTARAKTDAVAPLLAVPTELPFWARERPRPEPVPSRPLAPSQPGWAEPAARSPLEPGGARAADGVKRGLLVHRLLQALPELPRAARGEACRRYLARPAHLLDAEEQAAIAQETLAVLDDPGFAPLFGPGSLAEVPIVGLVGEHAVAGQIDRLVVLPGEVLIVDYKTLRPPPAREADIPEAYLRQLALYAGAVARIWPDRPVRAALLWTDGPRLMGVSHALLTGWIP
jgi:ATP-dependent helicase/nuclease subunit A